MRPPWIIIAGALAALAIAGFMPRSGSDATTAPRAPDAYPTVADGVTVGETTAPWRAPADLRQIPIWPHGAPDMADQPHRPERVSVSETPEALSSHVSEGVHDITEPTMTVYPPRGRNTGAAMVVFPGGGFRVVVITSEGTEICNWITARGITCILSKYRVPGSNDYWNKECRCQITPDIPRALQDAQRTIRLVRSRARELGIQPNKIGVIGFSAGGYLVAQTSNIFAPAYAPIDDVDRISSRPDFAIALYPGHLCRRGATLDPTIHVTKRTPPTFLLQAWDDPVDPICNSTLYARALDAADVPTEVHLFAEGGHAFTMRDKSHPVAIWPSLVERWLAEIGIVGGPA